MNSAKTLKQQNEIDISIIVKILWNFLCQYNKIYIKEKKKVQTEDEKKNVANVATVLLGTVATVQN